MDAKESFWYAVKGIVIGGRCLRLCCRPRLHCGRVFKDSSGSMLVGSSKLPYVSGVKYQTYCSDEKPHDITATDLNIKRQPKTLP